MMIAAEVNAKALSTYMGHSSIRLTFDLYGHLMPGNEDEGAGLLDAHLDRANTQARLAAVESADGKVIMESRGKVMGKSNSHQTGPDGARRE